MEQSSNPRSRMAQLGTLTDTSWSTSVASAKVCLKSNTCPWLHSFHKPGSADLPVLFKGPHKWGSFFIFMVPIKKKTTLQYLVCKKHAMNHNKEAEQCGLHPWQAKGRQQPQRTWGEGHPISATPCPPPSTADASCIRLLYSWAGPAHDKQQTFWSISQSTCRTYRACEFAASTISLSSQGSQKRLTKTIQHTNMRKYFKGINPKCLFLAATSELLISFLKLELVECVVLLHWNDFESLKLLEYVSIPAGPPSESHPHAE